MRTVLLFATAVLSAATISAQPAAPAPSGKVIYFTHVDTPQGLQEILNAVRGVGDIQNVTVDPSKKTFTVNGTADQIALAQWLCGELDKSAPATAFTKRQYPTGDSRSPVVQVFFLARTDTPQALQEAVNASRSVADIQRFFPIFAVRAIAARGTADQVSLAEWVLTEIDSAAQTMQSPVTHDHPVVGMDPRSGTLAQVFYPAHTKSPKEVQEMVNITRSVADLQRLFPNTARNVLVIRGTPHQVALADWLLTQMDKPATQAPASLDFTATGDLQMGNQVRLIFLANPTASQDIVNQVRTETKMSRVFYNSSRNAIAMRGTGDQIARAEQLIKERDRP
jgi:type II secretory pathway component GspD/PulD (secretin)